MGEQLADGAVAERRAGQVPVERVVEVQPALVAQPHHHDGGDRLADRPEPVLDVGVRLGHLAPARPTRPARRRGRRPATRLGARPSRWTRAVRARRTRAVVGRTGSGMTATVATRAGAPPVRRGDDVSRAGSRPVRVAQRSNQTVTSGGTDATRASSVVPGVPAQDPARPRGRRRRRPRRSPPWIGPKTWTPTSEVSGTYLTNMPASRPTQEQGLGDGDDRGRRWRRCGGSRPDPPRAAQPQVGPPAV